MGLEVKKGEYARLKGVAPSYITKLIGKGVVVLSADGKRVDVEATDRALAASASVDRQGVRDHHERARLASAIDPHASGASEAPQAFVPHVSAAASAPGARGNKDFDAFNQARAKKESELARLAELERMEREGALVTTASVKSAAGRVAVAITRGLERISARLAPKLAAETDEHKCALMIEAEVAQIREDFAEEIHKIAGEEAPAAQGNG